MKWRVLGLVLGLSFFLSIAGAACASRQATERVKETPKVELPAYVASASSEVQDAYRYALDHPEMLQYNACYCSCDRAGHTSVLDCFISEIKADGSVIWDSHGFGCHICVNIALDVERLSREGRSLTEIRSLIDESYSILGPGTNTPFPPLT